MSAIYQRARPIHWEDVVGQEHVKDVLKAALAQGRVGHAYLFSGPRGVGKTTTARLIAMTANCTSGGPKPCGECESCLAVRAGSHPDVLEIDAASNNSVDDVRDLREKVGLAAMRGGKKIYILDEAHMMSRAAFNALLKTLEEPPGHVIFILATTEPEKIIPTILSRCQHYRFRRLTPEEIAGKLAGLATQEGATADPDALNLIGRLADGAMRDGESLLERMLAAGTAITRASVEEALGLPPGERVRGIAGALVVGDAGAALAGAAGLYRDGFAARTVVEGLVAAFGAALHAELGLGEEGRLDGADVPRLLKLQAALDEQESRFARSADQQSLELALTHALLAADAVAGTGQRAGPGPAAAVPTDLVQRLNRLEKELSTLRSTGGRPGVAPVADFDPVARRGQAPVPVAAGREAVGEAAGTVSAAAAPAGLRAGTWEELLRAVQKIGGPQVRAFLKEGRHEVRQDAIYIVFDKLNKSGKPSNKFHGDGVVRNAESVAAGVWEVFGNCDVHIDNFGESKKISRKNKGTEPLAAAVQETLPAPALPPAAPPTSTPLGTPASDPAAGIPDFEPASRRASQRGPGLEPPDSTPQMAAPTSASSGTVTPGTANPVSTAPVSAGPGGISAGPPPRRGSVATLEPSPEPPGETIDFDLDAPFAPMSGQRTASVRPDDVAPAPLPERPPAPWEEETPADPPPAPADAQGGDRIVLPGASRELYVVEAITEEPDWGDIGGAIEEGGPPLLDDAPFAQYSVERPGPPQPRPAAPVPAAPALPNKPADIRAHPMYEDIRARFSGRVREIGKNRHYQGTPEETADDDSADQDSADTEA